MRNKNVNEPQNKQSCQNAVSDSCGNVKFTRNTLEARKYLESQGFKGLSFFQGKDFIYAFLTTWCNKNGAWKEKDYSTFSETDKERIAYLTKNASELDEFKVYIENLK